MVGPFIARTAGQPFDWGRMNCAFWCADLVLEARGVDPAADLRGQIGRAFDARRVVMRAGGLRALIRARMWEPDQGPGDGVCTARWAGQTICGIRTGGLLALKTPRGVLFEREFETLDFWGL
jgi:hypothetical protein